MKYSREQLDRMQKPVTQIARDQEIDFSLYTNNDDNQILNLGNLRVSLNKNDLGHRVYFSKDWYFESMSPFFGLVQDKIAPKFVFDLGGNNGVSATIAGHYMPDAKVVAVEAIAELIPYIKYNLYSNMVDDFDVIHGAIGDSSLPLHFYMNPHGSLDSRVNAPNANWKKRSVPQLRFDDISRDVGDDDPVYLKVDIQGYEPFFMDGAEKFFDRSKRFIMKSEFGPHWIESQGRDPLAFLQMMTERFDVYEFPARFAMGQGLTRAYLGKPFKTKKAAELIDTMRDFYRDRLGFIDILVTPKGLLS